MFSVFSHYTEWLCHVHSFTINCSTYIKSLCVSNVIYRYMYIPILYLLRVCAFYTKQQKVKWHDKGLARLEHEQQQQQHTLNYSLSRKSWTHNQSSSNVYEIPIITHMRHMCYLPPPAAAAAAHTQTHTTR